MPRVMAGSSGWFTLEDAKAAFNLFCCVYGIGTLGMPANFARAGPFYASVALLFMAFANVYASVAVSRVMLVAPPTVKTYSDLGEWAMGPRGRWAVVISQIAVCLLVPCAFLVLGGTLLQVLFPGAFSQSFWIVFMATMVLPVCLIPTLKEGAGVAFAGCLGTLLSDIIAIGVLIHGMRGSPSASSTPPAPDVSVHQVLTTFGNLSLAYGAAIVIPDLQRQHSQPQRMPRVIGVTLTFISILFLVLATTGYRVAGCQISGNLLFSITGIHSGDVAGASPLGFTAHRGAVVLAFFFMQVHITIAFAVILHPAFYTAERLLLGMHRASDQYHNMERAVHDDADDGDNTARASSRDVLRYVTLRCALVTLLVLLALALRDHFLELADFIGASCIAVCCLILPLLFYVRVLGDSLSRVERTVALAIVGTSALFGVYVTLSAGLALLRKAPRADGESPFPFCPAN